MKQWASPQKEGENYAIFFYKDSFFLVRRNTEKVFDAKKLTEEEAENYLKERSYD